jgi:2-methylcitrate dehydratase PrpD
MRPLTQLGAGENPICRPAEFNWVIALRMLPAKNVTNRWAMFQTKTNAPQVSASYSLPTRRNVLQGASAAALAAIVSRARAAQSVGPIMAQLSAYMAGARERELPAGVVEKAKHHILDTVAAMISGSHLAPGEAAIRFARAYGGERIATVVGSDVLCGPIEAAMANGMLAHADETDDSHAPSLSHPGCAVVPAALAAGERFGIDGIALLRAVVLGYDIGPRVTMAIGPLMLHRDLHRSSHSIAGVFGAAAAAGCAARLDAQKMRWLIDYTAQQASGISAWQRDSEHIEKAFAFGGMPARSGVTAALVVQAGWTGIDDILSGPDNFLIAHAPQAEAAGVVDKLGERYEIMRTNIKKWPVGSPIQAPLDALEILHRKRAFTADEVRQVTVRAGTLEAGVVNNRDIPHICLQHMVAVMLIDGTVSFEASHDLARMRDPAILVQRAKVDLIGDDELERRAPRREAIVRVTLTDGTELSEHVEAVRGTAENPMPRDEAVAKSRDLIVPVLGPETAARLIDAVLTIESLKNIRELRPLLQVTPR